MNKKQYFLIAGIVLAIILSGILFISNSSLKKNLKGEKIKSEALLSEKLNLDKTLEKSNKDLGQMKAKNVNNEKKIVELSQKIEAKEAEVNKLRAENASIKALKAKIKDLESLKIKLNEEIESLKITNTNLLKENKNIADNLETTKTEKAKLVETNTILRALASNNYMVEAVRGKKDKLTVYAKRAQKLIVTFDLPQDVGKSISFKLLTPEGLVYDSKENGSATINIAEKSDNFYSGVDNMEKTGTKTVEMIFIPEEKLSKQVYQFDIFDQGQYIGSTHIRLR